MSVSIDNRCFIQVWCQIKLHAISKYLLCTVYVVLCRKSDIVFLVRRTAENFKLIENGIRYTVPYDKRFHAGRLISCVVKNRDRLKWISVNRVFHIGMGSHYLAKNPIGRYFIVGWYSSSGNNISRTSSIFRIYRNIFWFIFNHAGCLIEGFHFVNTWIRQRSPAKFHLTIFFSKFSFYRKILQSQYIRLFCKVNTDRSKKTGHTRKGYKH